MIPDCYKTIAERAYYLWRISSHKVELIPLSVWVITGQKVRWMGFTLPGLAVLAYVVAEQCTRQGLGTGLLEKKGQGCLVRSSL